MVEKRVTDGVRIAQLLSSELDGREDGALDALSVTDAEDDVEGTPDGERAYDVERSGEPLARVFVHEDRARIELRDGHEPAVEAAENGGLRVRPKAVEPPRTILFVESGAEVKRAADVLDAVSAALEP